MNRVLEDSLQSSGHSVSWQIRRNFDHLLVAWVGVVGCLLLVGALASLATWQAQFVIFISMLIVGFVQFFNLMRATFFKPRERLSVVGANLLFEQSFPYFALEVEDAIPNLRNAFFTKRRFTFAKDSIQTVRIDPHPTRDALEIVLRTGESQTLACESQESLICILKELEKLGIPATYQGDSVQSSR